ncbi:MAG: ABC transporter permease [Pseudomonadota bacterium]
MKTPAVAVPFQIIGQQVVDVIQALGRVVLFFGRAFVMMFAYPFQVSKIVYQVHFIGMKSVLVICLTGAFTGMVLGLQGYYSLVKFGSEGFLGSAVALSLVRELGPVMAAIMVTARAGSAMAAEVGIMRISEQIDALETMGIAPIRFLVSPKLAAALISFPLLTAIFDVIGLYGGYLTGSLLLGANPVVYFTRAQSAVLIADVSGGFLKSVVFAAIVTTICCYHGYFTHLRREFGAKGVSLSTTTAVVQSCVLILVSDYVMTSFLM